MSGSTKLGNCLVASIDQQSKMTKTSQQVGAGASYEARQSEEKLLREQAVASVDILKNKKERKKVSSCCSLPPTSWPFPYRLMDMINWCESEHASKEGVSNYSCWSPDGKHFTINNKEKLSVHVLKRFFKDSKFDSFQRKLYRWGFKQVTSKRGSCGQGGDLSFYADGFERDGPPNSCFKLKVRYSKREKYERALKSLESKHKKMKKKSDTGITSGRFQSTSEQGLHPVVCWTHLTLELYLARMLWRILMGCSGHQDLI
jgi:hypothetical protein